MSRGNNGFRNKIKELHLKEIEYLSDKPSANDFSQSTNRDQRIIQGELLRLKNDFNIVSPVFKCLSDEKLHWQFIFKA